MSGRRKSEMPSDREQKLVDIMFQVAFAARGDKTLQGMNQDVFAMWIADQLRQCGFPNKPCGMSWAVLERED
jgi:hypothetical protein